MKSGETKDKNLSFVVHMKGIRELKNTGNVLRKSFTPNTQSILGQREPVPVASCGGLQIPKTKATKIYLL